MAGAADRSPSPVAEANCRPRDDDRNSNKHILNSGYSSGSQQISPPHTPSMPAVPEFTLGRHKATDGQQTSRLAGAAVDDDEDDRMSTGSLDSVDAAAAAAAAAALAMRTRRRQAERDAEAGALAPKEQKVQTQQPQHDVKGKGKESPRGAVKPPSLILPRAAASQWMDSPRAMGSLSKPLASAKPTKKAACNVGARHSNLESTLLPQAPNTPAAASAAPGPLSPAEDSPRPQPNRTPVAGNGGAGDALDLSNLIDLLAGGSGGDNANVPFGSEGLGALYDLVNGSPGGGNGASLGGDDVDDWTPRARGRKLPSERIKARSMAERQRRERISEGLQKLRVVVRGQGDTATMLDNAVAYVQQLQKRVVLLERAMFVHQASCSAPAAQTEEGVEAAMDAVAVAVKGGGGGQGTNGA